MDEKPKSWMGTRRWKRSMGWDQWTLIILIGEGYNKIKGKKWHYFVWLDHTLAAVLLGRLILLCMAPHHTCISGLSSVCQSPQAQDHCLLLLAQQPSDKWFVPGAALQRQCCQEPVLVQQPSLSSGCWSGVEAQPLLTPDTLYLPVPQPLCCGSSFQSGTAVSHRPDQRLFLRQQ